MVFDAALLNTQHYKVQIEGKVEQSREGVAPSPAPWCSSYRKGSLRVTLDYGRQLYLLTYLFKSSYELSDFWMEGAVYFPIAVNEVSVLFNQAYLNEKSL